MGCLDMWNLDAIHERYVGEIHLSLEPSHPIASLLLTPLPVMSL